MEEQPIKIKPIRKTKGFQDLKFKKEDIDGIYTYISAINKNNSLSANENNLINQLR